MILMSNEPNKPNCDVYPVCTRLFERINEKLTEMHLDMISVRDENSRINMKMSNGMSTDIARLKERQEYHRVLIYALWGLVGGIVTAALVYIITKK